jgi:hypothetical protein
MRKGLWLGMRSPFSAEIVSSRNLTLVHRREHINEVQSGTTKLVEAAFCELRLETVRKGVAGW